MNVVLDIEADALRPLATRIWCAVAMDEEESIYRFYPLELMTDLKPRDYPLSHLIPFLKECDDVCMHNGIDFDRWLINKVYGYMIPMERVTDTLILSQLLDQARFQHSVESYGKQFGVHKQEHEDWSRFSPEMLKRCETDVFLQRKILDHLIKKAEE